MRLRGPIVFVLVAISCLGAAALAFAASSHGPDPAVKEWAGWSEEVACGSGPRFDPLVAFSRPTGAERGKKPSEKALREFVDDKRIAYLGIHRHNWRLLAGTPNEKVFGQGGLKAGRIQVVSVVHRKTGWKAVGYASACQLAVLPEGGHAAITWTLARGQHLTPSTTSIEVNLGPGECDSGQGQNDRLEAPVFREENGALLMALWLRPVGGGAQTCQALIEPPVTIQLPEPLGSRKLLDGGVFPPLSSAQQLRLDDGR